MSILARIRTHGGDIIRTEWRFSLKRGRLTQEAIAWLRAHWLEACCEAWPMFDAWVERAAIREYDARCDESASRPADGQGRAAGSDQRDGCSGEVVTLPGRDEKDGSRNQEGHGDRA